jgi:hypothetical protein
MSNMTNHFDAYARMLITFAMPQIHQLFLAEAGQAAPVKASGLSGIVVTQAQIDAALLNPLNHFIKFNLSLGAEALKQINEMAFQVLPYCTEVDAMIEQFASQLKMPGVIADPAELKNAQAKLRKFSEKVADLFGQAKQLEKEELELQEQSAQLAVEQHQEWQAFRHHYCAELCKALEENGVPLSDAEKEAIMQNESIVEIIQRYESLNLPMPVNKEKLPEKASYFFHLLAWFTIHASLSRRLEPHTPGDVNKFLE